MNVNHLINEEIKRIMKEFYGEEESITDKWYEKRLGIYREKKREDDDVDGEYVGSTNKDVLGKQYRKPIAIYKNPKRIKNIGYNARGVILENGDFFIAKSAEALHDDIIAFLIEKRFLPHTTDKNYTINMPKEYVCVERNRFDSVFTPAYFYVDFPSYYEKIFERANKIPGRNYAFKPSVSEKDMDEQFDMNRSFSYMPKDLDPNRNWGRPF